MPFHRSFDVLLTTWGGGVVGVDIHSTSERMSFPVDGTEVYRLLNGLKLALEVGRRGDVDIG